MQFKLTSVDLRDLMFKSSFHMHQSNFGICFSTENLNSIMETYCWVACLVFRRVLIEFVSPVAPGLVKASEMSSPHQVRSA